MTRDVLLLLEPGFTDPAYLGERFICPHAAPIEAQSSAVGGTSRFSEGALSEWGRAQAASCRAVRAVLRSRQTDRSVYFAGLLKEILTIDSSFSVDIPRCSRIRIQRTAA
ncbi:hypothetical protein C0Z18_06115 [Trinickia dabaoshanensis]|uniref:Uncharacterized protein n=1 Tax=Trinickia dabaoshanensis TaxID=564714 RepID=A0A2N7VY90_9BURK|nr:DUF3088 family protein [Trinickia dabaoshanensis]PMS22090.1 hypothetical protein C0Z18_06115 [Trinickia dabaoshanensis]